MKSNEPFSNEVRRKAARMARARAGRDTFWKHLVHVGVLGWVFVLPVVVGAVAGRLLARWTQLPHVDIAMLLAGVLVGSYAAWREIRRSLEDRA